MNLKTILITGALTVATLAGTVGAAGAAFADTPNTGMACQRASTVALAHGLGKKCEAPSDAYTAATTVHADGMSVAYVTLPARAAGDTFDPASLTVTAVDDDPATPSAVTVAAVFAVDSVTGTGDAMVKIRNLGGATTVTLTLSYVSA